MRLPLALTLFLALSFCSFLPAEAVSLPFAEKPVVAPTSLVANDLLAFARKHLGIRYRGGGTSRRGFDCSGFTRHCFQHFGMSLPHSSAAQGTVGLVIDRAQAQPGDLIFFKGHSIRGKRIGHVGLITKIMNGQIQFIHSAWKGGVRYDYAHAAYYQRRFMSVRRVGKLLAMSH
jgi:murein DD-endopeptidase / murein LD-carboxypeptidase